MGLTRKMLTSMGIEPDKVETIIEAHLETVGGLKDELAAAKAEAEKLPAMQKELDEAKKAAKNSGDAAKIQKEFDDFKAEVANKETLAKKSAALREIAKDAGLSEAGIAKAVKYAEWDKIELDDKGAIKDKSGVMKGLKEEWPEYITTTKTVGADTPTPPASEQKQDKGTGANPRAAELAAKYTNSLYGVGANNEKKGD